MPDFDLRSSASFISSKEGGTPLSRRRSWMKRSSSFCFRVSIVSPPRGFDSRLETKHEHRTCSPCVPQASLFGRYPFLRLVLTRLRQPRPMRFAYSLLAALALLGPTAALAHPHVWVRSKATIMYDGSARI